MKHLSEEIIAQYAEALEKGDISSIPKAVREHVKECNQCADEIIMVNEIISSASKQKAELSKPIVRRLFSSPWISVAAGIAIIVSIGIYFSFVKNSAEETSDHLAKQEIIPVKVDAFDSAIRQEKDSENKQVIEPEITPQAVEKVIEKVQQQQPLLAEAFIPNTRLEKLAERYEGGHLRGDNLKLESPHVLKTHVETDISLYWDIDTDQELTFSLLDNHSKIVFEEAANRDGITFYHTLPKGLYYWQLLNEDFDLLYCGKIELK